MRKATGSLLVVLLLSLDLSPALADDSDIFSRNIQPNVMILLDSSGSMGDDVPSAPYLAATTYSGSRTSTVVYQGQTRKGKTTYSTYRNTVAQVPNVAAQTALSTDGYWTGSIGGSKVRLFTGNYLNYQASVGGTTQPKIVIAKRVITNLINNVQGVRFGLMKFGNNSTKAGGGQVVSPIGTDKATMIAALNAIVEDGWTPTGEQIRDAGLYFKGQFGYPTPIQLECQPNFVIVISDGLWNGTVVGHPAPQGAALFTTDHHTGLSGMQNIIVHTVSFGIEKSEPTQSAQANEDLKQTAVNGGGNFYLANDAVALEQGLQDAIRQIIAGTFTFASPVIPTTSAAGTSRAYLAAFQSDPIRTFWPGYLSAYTRDTNGLVRVLSDGTPDPAYRVWEAGDLLRQKSASTRTIYTVVSGARETFTTGNSNITDALLGTGASSTLRYEFKIGTSSSDPLLTRDFTLSINSSLVFVGNADSNKKVILKKASDLGWTAPATCLPDCYGYRPNGADPTGAPVGQRGFVGSFSGRGSGFDIWVQREVPSAAGATKNQVIDFIRGIDTFDEDADGNVTEERAWKLGDIFHSSPVLVGPPSLPSADTSYKDFKTANASRTKVLIAGANDGMLHAFQESDGQELWGFIPSDVLGDLKYLGGRTGHEFYVDSSPVAADVKIGGAWKTIVVFGERRGGRSYHALDITDTTNPLYLWSFNDTRMGETWSEPAIGKVKMNDGTTKFVAFFGGGYDTEVNNFSGKAFFAIDLATGAKLWEYYNSASDDRQYMNFSLAGSPTIVDTNNDGFVDYVYIGDVGGQVWKFDVSAPATLSSGPPPKLVTNWTGKRLFAADPSQANPPASGEYYPAQAIYGAPTVSFDDKANLWVFFGTGDRNHPNNVATNRFFGIKDNTTMTNGSALTPSDLVDITSADLTASQGWFVRLGTDEKVLATADVFNNVVYFSAFTPTTIVACGTGGGTAKLYAVQMLTGYAALDWSNGKALTSSDSSKTRYTTVGTGIPASPTVVITSSGGTVTVNLVTATTSQQLANTAAPGPASLKRVIYWREVR